MKKLVLFLCFITIAWFAVACTPQDDGESSPVSYTITFVQEGQADEVKTVERGGGLQALPEIKATPPVGYSYEWERTDFSSISGNITIRLKAVPNKYTIHYDIGDDSYAWIESETQSVAFDEEISLFQPTRFGYKFAGWVEVASNQPFTLEKYTTTGDTYLVAKWSVDAESDRWFTPDL